MSSGEVFVKIDASQLEALLSQLQGAGTGDGGTNPKWGPGGGVLGGGASAPTREAYTMETLRKEQSKYYSSKYTKFGGSEGMGFELEESEGAFQLPSINRGVRTAIGITIPGGYEAINQYNRARWFLKGGVAGISTGAILFAAEFISVMRELEANRKKQEEMIREMSDITGPAYEQWKRTQSQGYRRTAN
jgi:hypothetical protein